MGKKSYAQYKHFIYICNGGDCKKKGAKDLLKACAKDLKSKGLTKVTKQIKTQCTGRCKEAPVMLVKDHWLTRVKTKDVPAVLTSCLLLDPMLGAGTGTKVLEKYEERSKGPVK